MIAADAYPLIFRGSRLLLYAQGVVPVVRNDLLRAGYRFISLLILSNDLCKGGLYNDISRKHTFF